MTLAWLDVNRAYLPLTEETRKCLSYALSTIAAEYEKGEHSNTVTFELSLPPNAPEV